MGKVASDKCHKWVFKEPSECEPNISNYWQSSFDAVRTTITDCTPCRLLSLSAVSLPAPPALGWGASQTGFTARLTSTPLYTETTSNEQLPIPALPIAGASCCHAVYLLAWPWRCGVMDHGLPDRTVAGFEVLLGNRGQAASNRIVDRDTDTRHAQTYPWGRGLRLCIRSAPPKRREEWDAHALSE